MRDDGGMPSSSDTYLHGHHDSVLRSHRWRTAENSAGYLLPRLKASARVLDVGCGPGTITADLAARVPDGGVVAIDAAADVLDLARAEAGRRGQANVRFEVGDVYELGFEDASFDVVHAHQVLQHLSDPVAALREMRRVGRPGGLVAARDGDYGGFIWFPEDPELTEWRTLYKAVARALGGEPDGGRHLLSWARQAGFEQIEASASAWCYAGPAGPGLVGRVVGRPADRVAVRGPGRRAWPGHQGRPGAAGRGMAAVGRQRGRLAAHPERRDLVPGLGRDRRVRGRLGRRGASASRTRRTAGLRSPPRRLTVKIWRVTGSAGASSRTPGGRRRGQGSGRWNQRPFGRKILIFRCRDG